MITNLEDIQGSTTVAVIADRTSQEKAAIREDENKCPIERMLELFEKAILEKYEKRYEILGKRITFDGKIELLKFDFQEREEQ